MTGTFGVGSELRPEAPRVRGKTRLDFPWAREWVGGAVEGGGADPQLCTHGGRKLSVLDLKAARRVTPVPRLERAVKDSGGKYLDRDEPLPSDVLSRKVERSS